MSRIFQYLKEVRNELFKVIWPSRTSTLKMTVTVIVFSVLVALFLGLVDFGLIKLVEQAFRI